MSGDKDEGIPTGNTGTYKIDQIEGIGPVMTEKLATANIKTTGDLLHFCADKNGRAEIAKISGASEKQLLKWANMADLMRISGVGEEYSELLEAAGVDTVKELRKRNAVNLAAAMRETNEERKLTRAVPGSATVEKWVDQAKRLSILISH